MRLIGLTVLAVYSVGYLAAIPIVYRMLADNQLTQKNKNAYSGNVNRLDTTDVLGSAAGATVIGLVWWAALPFCIAFVLRHGRRLNPEREADRLTEDFRHRVEVRAQLANARKAIAQETTGIDETARRSPYRYRSDT